MSKKINLNPNLRFKHVIAIILIAIVFGSVDYYRVTHSKSPIFSHHCYSYKDGGTRVYFGLLYKITWWHIRQDSRIRRNPSLDILYIPLPWIGGNTYIPVIADQVLSEWRPPTLAELSQDSLLWRQSEANLYLRAIADFDGDSKADTAQLMINDKTDRMGLFITLTSLNESKPILISQREKGAIKDIGIRIVKPGEHKTARAKGYGGKSEPAILKLSTHAVDYFEYNPQYKFFNSYYFVYDIRANIFNMFWIDNWYRNNS